MTIKKLLILLLVLGGAALAWLWNSESASDEQGDIVLFGNVDLRQVALAFTSSERIAQMHVQEGDTVTQGQVLARLDSTMLALRIRQAQAQVQVQQEAVNRLRAGSRPQEIAQTESAISAAQAELTAANAQLQRLQSVSAQSDGRAVSAMDIEAAQARAAVAQANLQRAQETRDLAVLGPAVEDIAGAEAALEAARAQLAVMEQQLIETELKAPIDAVVRSRLLEPGDMASPQRPLYTLAITDNKWVRAYVSEVDLGRVRAGQSASVTIDSFPDEALTGQVGYIASVAEFTPKTVQTQDLRSSLVYEIRIHVDDPQDRLRLGMPATVQLQRDMAAQ